MVGIRDPDVPVLPEYLVTKVEEKVKSLASRRATEKGLAPWQTHKLSTWERVVISLRHLVRMQRHWGAKNASLSLFCINENNNLNLPRQARDNHRENSEKRDDAFVSFAGALWDIYETRKDAIYGDEADDSITIRNPNSKFSVRERISLIHLRHFVLKMIIILPRQARDKHKESSTEKRTCFCRSRGMCCRCSCSSTLPARCRSALASGCRTCCGPRPSGSTSSLTSTLSRTSVRKKEPKKEPFGEPF